MINGIIKRIIYLKNDSVYFIQIEKAGKNKGTIYKTRYIPNEFIAITDLNIITFDNMGGLDLDTKTIVRDDPIYAYQNAHQNVD